MAPSREQTSLPCSSSRYHNDVNHLTPSFTSIYPLGRAEDTVPSYESQPIGKTIAEHVEAVGGIMDPKGRPDIVLAVNTPFPPRVSPASFPITA